MLLQCSGRFGSVVPVLDSLHLGLALPIRQSARPGFGISILGRCAVGPSILAVSLANVDSSASLRSFAQLGPVALLPGSAHLGFLLPVRSFARLGPLILVLELGHLGLLMSLQSLGHLDFSLSALGLARMGSCFFAFDAMHLDLPVFVRSTVRLEFAPFLVEFAHLGPVVLLRSPACFDFATSVLDFLHLGSTLLLRSSCKMGFLISTFEGARTGGGSFVVNSATTGFPALLRSFARLGGYLSILEQAHVGFLVLMRSFLHAGLTLSAGAVSITSLSVYGSCLGGKFSVVGISNLDFSVLTHSFAHLDFALSVLDPGHFESSIFVQTSACLGLMTLACGWAKFESLVSLFGLATVGFLVSLRSYAHLGPALSVLECSTIDFPISVQSFGRTGSAVLVFDFIHMGLLLLVPSSGEESLTRSAPPMLALDFVHPNSSLLLRGFAHMGFTSSVLAPVICGSTSSVVTAAQFAKFPVTGITALGSSTSLRNSARPDFSLPALGEVWYVGVSVRFAMRAALGSVGFFSLSELCLSRPCLVNFAFRALWFSHITAKLCMTWFTAFTLLTAAWRMRAMEVSAFPTFSNSRFLPSLAMLKRSKSSSGLSAAGTLQVPNTVSFSPNSYMYYTGTQIQWYMAGTRVLAFDGSGGTLHNTWVSNTVLTVSDRRLKKDIKPLQRSLRDLLTPQASEPDVATAAPAGAPKGEDAGALWMLRQLRPVSYYFKKGSESKYMRFGFIADELESVVPQVVRQGRSDELSNPKSVVYTDLIALLTAAAQGQQQVIERQQGRMDKLLSDFASLKTELVNLKQEEFEVPRKNLRGEKKKKKSKSGKGAKKPKAELTDTSATENATNVTNLTNTTESWGGLI
eukprot:s154_g39.t1